VSIKIFVIRSIARSVLGGVGTICVGVDCSTLGILLVWKISDSSLSALSYGLIRIEPHVIFWIYLPGPQFGSDKKCTQNFNRRTWREGACYNGRMQWSGLVRSRMWIEFDCLMVAVVYVYLQWAPKFHYIVHPHPDLTFRYTNPFHVVTSMLLTFIH
jgi:hypothetical protein